MARNFVCGFIYLLMLGFACTQNNRTQTTRIFLIGDSTMANKPFWHKPETGWGQVFPEFFNETVEIHNHAKNGRSSKSFIDQGLWQKVFNSLREGDFVMIQFGHNDQKISDPTRYAAPYEAYKDNLRRYVTETRQKGAQPILITPVMRRNFDKTGQFHDLHGEYPNVVREVAAQMDVPVIDLHRSSGELLVRMGADETQKIFLWVKPGESLRFPDGIQDNTHFSEYGARQVAGLVAKGIQALDLKLKDHLKR